MILLNLEPLLQLVCILVVRSTWWFKGNLELLFEERRLEFQFSYINSVISFDIFSLDFHDALIWSIDMARGGKIYWFRMLCFFHFLCIETKKYAQKTDWQNGGRIWRTRFCIYASLRIRIILSIMLLDDILYCRGYHRESSISYHKDRSVFLLRHLFFLKFFIVIWK